MDMKKINGEYSNLISRISAMYAQARENVVSAVNRYLVESYWQIGKYIVEFEQGGKAKAGYGAALLENLSRDLSLMHGKGFSRSNLNYMRQVYTTYPICEEIPHKLSWTHLCEFVKISDPLERSFYEKQTILKNWSTTELKRQKKAALFLRLAASKDKEGVLQLAQQGQIIAQPADRHCAGPRKRRTAGQIRHAQRQLATLCLQIPTLFARPRRTESPVGTTTPRTGG